MRVLIRFLFVVLEKKKYTAYDRFHSEIPTKKELMRTLRFTSRLPCHIIDYVIGRLGGPYREKM